MYYIPDCQLQRVKSKFFNAPLPGLPLHYMSSEFLATLHYKFWFLGYPNITLVLGYPNMTWEDKTMYIVESVSWCWAKQCRLLGPSWLLLVPPPCLHVNIFTSLGSSYIQDPCLLYKYITRGEFLFENNYLCMHRKQFSTLGGNPFISGEGGGG